MKIYGFLNNGISSCGEDTRFMSDEDVIDKLEQNIKYSITSLNKLKEDMSNFAKLSRDYRYDLNANVGRCFIDMDCLNQDIEKYKNLINKIKIKRK